MRNEIWIFPILPLAVTACAAELRAEDDLPVFLGEANGKADEAYGPGYYLTFVPFAGGEVPDEVLLVPGKWDSFVAEHRNDFGWAEAGLPDTTILAANLDELAASNLAIGLVRPRVNEVVTTAALLTVLMTEEGLLGLALTGTAVSSFFVRVGEKSLYLHMGESLYDALYRVSHGIADFAARALAAQAAVELSSSAALAWSKVGTVAIASTVLRQWRQDGCVQLPPESESILSLCETAQHFLVWPPVLNASLHATLLTMLGGAPQIKPVVLHNYGYFPNTATLFGAYSLGNGTVVLQPGQHAVLSQVVLTSNEAAINIIPSKHPPVNVWIALRTPR